MAKFFLFVYEQYEASGGLGDLQGTFETLKDAEVALMPLVGKDYAHIVTVDTDGDLLIVSEYTCSPYPLDKDGKEDHYTNATLRVRPRWLREIGHSPNYEPFYEVVEVTVP